MPHASAAKGAIRAALIVAAAMLVPSWTAAAETVVARAPVPSADRPQGEVRVVRREGAAVVQTILWSRVLRRALGRIADKEAANWPADAAGAEQSRRYVDALASRADADRDAASEAGGERRRALSIEFVRGSDEVYVAIGVPRVREGEGGLEIDGLDGVERLGLTRAYVERNMILIVADVFGGGEANAREILAQAGFEP